MDIEPVFNYLKGTEKDILKHLALLFPCYYLVLYLFYADFSYMSIFEQCMVTAATTIIIYFAIGIAELLRAIAGNFAGIGRIFVEVFRMNILLVVLCVVVGFYCGYSICSLRKVFWAIVAFLLIKIVCGFYRRITLYKKGG